MEFSGAVGECGGVDLSGLTFGCSIDFRPTTPMMISARQTKRPRLRGSVPDAIPISTMPVVPRPVQTA